ncbi:unnamed protein product [Durusdinium trenchii]|uniref:Uncharacterized protein n=1 Tax=Durusdinium trenchii TaxID=1381693 RepID=A0ABP0SV59_9DINO
MLFNGWLMLLLTMADAVYDGCSTEESQGIAQCESTGEGFLFDQNKAARCPDPNTWDFASWSCDDWKCHMYCSNPTRSSERKSCDNCPEVEVSTSCFDAQKAACNSASANGCDVNCNDAGPLHRANTALVAASLFLLPSLYGEL